MQTLERISNFLLVTVIFGCSSCTAAEKVIYNFPGQANGYVPDAPLVLDKAGNLYGTTTGGGDSSCGGIGCGGVFKVTRGANGQWTESVLYSFTGGSDGAYPYAGLVFDPAGNLYGTADSGGGFSGCGTVFELAFSSGSWTESTLYTFGGGNDGCGPRSSLTMDSSGNLFGTTQPGGLGAGTVFELTPSVGGWTESVLWAFSSIEGASPLAGVVFDSAGNIYGTANLGGVFGSGTVFRLTPASGGGWTGTTIFSFTGGDNGCEPLSVVFDSVGNLYGTTQRCGADEVGTIFKLSPTVGQWKMSVLHAFTGASDGAYPNSGLLFDNTGNLWGTTQLGGSFADGTVFRLTPPSSSGGRSKESEYSFIGGDDGAFPSAGVVFGNSSSGTLVFGTTTSGGTNNLGAVYQISAKE